MPTRNFMLCKFKQVNPACFMFLSLYRMESVELSHLA
jgi:hypothetical protein